MKVAGISRCEECFSKENVQDLGDMQLCYRCWGETALWYACSVEAGQEFKAIQNLDREKNIAGIILESMLPLDSELKLMYGYLFVKLVYSPELIQWVSEQKHILGVLPIIVPIGNTKQQDLARKAWKPIALSTPEALKLMILRTPKATIKYDEHEIVTIIDSDSPYYQQQGIIKRVDGDKLLVSIKIMGTPVSVYFKTTHVRKA